MKLSRTHLMQIIILITIVLSTLFSIRAYLLSPPEDTYLSNGVRLEWKTCSFDIPLTQIIHCATLYPSMQNEQLNTSLPIVVVKNVSLDHQPDPVLYIHGGPGAATGVKGIDIEYWLEQISELNWNRDFILYDQRGTGESTPEIQCRSFKDFFYDVLTNDLPAKEVMQNIFAHHKECQTLVQVYDGDISGYSTKYNTQDVIDLTQALKYKKWNLYGVSYGTRVSLEVMRRQPDNIRSVILDSVFPSNKHDLLTWPAILDSAINNIFVRCDNDKTCQSTYPDLRGLFEKALQNLKNKSMLVKMPNFYSDGGLNVYIDDSRFVEALFFALYYSDLVSSIPDVINDVAHGRQNLLIPIVTRYADMAFDEYSNVVTFNSVLCNDENAISREHYEAEVDKYPMVKAYTTGVWDYNTCKIWRTNSEITLNTVPVKSTIPTIVLAGNDDSVTPWQWGKEVHESLANSVYYVYPNTAHGVIGPNKCATRMTATFLNQLKVPKEENCL